ncbi:MAG: MFS transporter, partial [Thermoplasmataceae archaeon]
MENKSAGLTIFGLNRTEISQVLAAWGGWLLDGYVSIAYLVALADTGMSTAFFPASLHYLGFLLTIIPVTFSAIARSFGSTVLGNFLGDRIGRKTLLTVSIIGFTIFSAAIGIIPPYSQIGIFSPILLYIVL